ncbi:hypothetical protein CYMTET_43558 [Cymbomonas tetramitiformis]|uniref:Integrase catalytic domain-containing protein n=1 Tax=Cymbomonas tetramitiformis TaxID=36881 RepID=A0AAE0C310_9CHLO|nr:hypothetical protein CYMTET_43558 [Cymbomonas tetramitiformis]
MTEHYTRFIICVPIPNKEALTIANAFRNHVLSVFGAPAECLMDGGKEFEGEFEELCRACLIVDRRDATVPPDLRKRPALDFAHEVMVNEYDSRVRDLVQRARVVKELMVTAGCNLEVAHHRDMLLYEGRRGGGFTPKPHKFQAEDKLKEGLGGEVRLLAADVGPTKRALREGAMEPWQALSKREIGRTDGSMLGDLPYRIDWGNREVFTDMMQELMPGHWHEEGRG